jgi:hypothetical protein
MMARFMYVFRGGAFVQQGLSPAEVGAHLQKWTAWVGELAKAGVHEGGYAVQGPGRRSGALARQSLTVRTPRRRTWSPATSSS